MNKRERMAAFFWNIVDPVVAWFVTRWTLIREQTNRGSVDGDEPADREDR